MMFDLPDFTESRELNALRSMMGAPLIAYEPQEASQRRISRRDLERLRTTGITVDLSEIETLPDGTFSYQGVSVLLYIMTPKQYGDSVRLPKYHVANCTTWDSMKRQGRQDRYVACTRVDGLFELDVVGSDGRSRHVTEALDVCKNCLDAISWNGFDFQAMRRSDRNRIFKDFALSDYFASRTKTQVREKPRWTTETFPGGSYTDDFNEVSSRARAAAKWRCQGECNRLFAAAWQRRFLHVHHRNGVPGDNSPDNLTVLCLGCHAKQPSHAHMRRSRDYMEFQRLFGDGSADGAAAHERVEF